MATAEPIVMVDSITDKPLGTMYFFGQPHKGDAMVDRHGEIGPPEHAYRIMERLWHPTPTACSLSLIVERIPPEEGG